MLKLSDFTASTVHNHLLDSLTNVTITSNSSGEILKWNGSAWINNTLSEAGIQDLLVSGTNIKTVNSTSLLGSGDITITSGGGAVGGGTDKVFYENDTVVTTSYTLTSGKNAMSAGPVTINNGAVVTVPDGSVWSVV